MATPTVTIVRLPLRNFVTCPLCTTQIARDARAYQVHMEVNHSATPGSWTDLGIRGNLIGMTGTRLFRDGSTVEYYAPTDYGCGAVFDTDALLIAHLLAVHNAS